jgi:phosphoenolpyruvate-protein kinase (PTS system EI component)
MAPALVPEVKEALRGVELADARTAARRALAADSASAARAAGQSLL